MEKLIFICPTSGKGVDIGVETEIGTLLRIRKNIVRAQCAACGKWHEWPVRDAFLAEAAETLVTRRPKALCLTLPRSPRKFPRRRKHGTLGSVHVQFVPVKAETLHLRPARGAARGAGEAHRRRP